MSDIAGRPWSGRDLRKERSLVPNRRRFRESAPARASTPLRRIPLGATTIVASVLLVFAGPSRVQNSVPLGTTEQSEVEVQNLRAIDTPNDRGESVTLSWKPTPMEAKDPTAVFGYVLERGESPAGPFREVGRVPAGTQEFADTDSLRDETPYFYRVRTELTGGILSEGAATVGPVASRGQLFDSRKTVTCVATVLFCLTVVWLIQHARRGNKMYIRPIPGLSAVDEAIGRATEMGRPILFVTGLGTSSDVATLAAFTLLGRVGLKTAEYQSSLIVPCYDPIVMTIAQEIVKSSYLGAGRPEMYRQDDVFFVTQDQFSYTAAVNGIMLRERPATNFYIGKFYAESLVLAETGNLAGSIQIAGTDEITQIPFFVAACDYTLIGEELYASSAYLSQEPPLLGTLKAQDYAKAVTVMLLVLGVIAALLHQDWFVKLFLVE
jgi:hypothetical protein